MKISRKYSGDYRVFDEEDCRDRLHRRAEYIGLRYTLDTDASGARRLLRRIYLTVGLSVVFWLIPLIPNSTLVHNVPASLPFALTVIFISWFAVSAATLKRAAAGMMTRREHDKADGRLPVAAAICFLLTVISAVGCIYGYATADAGTIGITDILFGMMTVLQLPVFAYQFILTRKITYRENGNVRHGYGDE